jgi:hypothetical protein
MELEYEIIRKLSEIDEEELIETDFQYLFNVFLLVLFSSYLLFSLTQPAYAAEVLQPNQDNFFSPSKRIGTVKDFRSFKDKIKTITPKVVQTTLVSPQIVLPSSSKSLELNFVFPLQLFTIRK